MGAIGTLLAAKLPLASNEAHDTSKGSLWQNALTRIPSPIDGLPPQATVPHGTTMTRGNVKVGRRVLEQHPGFIGFR